MTDSRPLSHWGWGYADKFPDRAARQQLGQLLQVVLGFAPDTLDDPVPLDAIELPPSRITPPAALAAMVSATTATRASHTWGRNFADLVRGFRGDFSAAPDLVATPGSEQDVVALLDWCAEANIACIPYGGGTSVVGGVEARFDRTFAGALCMDLRRLDRVLEVDPVSRLARIQGGATGPVLEAQLATHGLTLRHFPQSFEFSTLGGWVATRAGGHFATVYTHIDELVASLRAVTPAGTVATRTLPGSGAGPDPNRLMIGSEGAFGVITEATMRVRPKPVFRAQVSVRFKDFNNAVAATRDLAQSGLFPANCRLLDKREAAMHQVVQDGSHVLIVAFESAMLSVAGPLEQATHLCRLHGGAPDAPKIVEPRAEAERGADSAGAWREAFINAPYLLNTLVSLGMVVDTFETACTWSTFDALHDDVIRSVRAAMKEVCGAGRLSCRFTHIYPDGPAPYYTFIAPGRRGSEVEQFLTIKAAACEALARNGATITHHHAVGRLHQPWYLREVSPLVRQAFLAAKQTFDPQGVLNPGVLFDA